MSWLVIAAVVAMLAVGMTYSRWTPGSCCGCGSIPCETICDGSIMPAAMSFTISGVTGAFPDCVAGCTGINATWVVNTAGDAYFSRPCGVYGVTADLCGGLGFPKNWALQCFLGQTGGGLATISLELWSVGGGAPPSGTLLATYKYTSGSSVPVDCFTEFNGVTMTNQSIPASPTSCTFPASITCNGAA